jgi:hypothetical protein
MSGPPRTLAVPSTTGRPAVHPQAQLKRQIAPDCPWRCGRDQPVHHVTCFELCRISSSCPCNTMSFKLICIPARGLTPPACWSNMYALSESHGDRRTASKSRCYPRCHPPKLLDLFPLSYRDHVTYNLKHIVGQADLQGVMLSQGAAFHEKPARHLPRARGLRHERCTPKSAAPRCYLAFERYGELFSRSPAVAWSDRSRACEYANSRKGAQLAWLDRRSTQEDDRQAGAHEPVLRARKAAPVPPCRA